jgi:predicted acylesterase/phospholipase RssA
MGAVQHLEEKKFIDRKNIKSIYGTSAGAILGILLCMDFDWESIRDYIIKRPWQDVFPVKVQNIFDAYTKKGLFDVKAFEKTIKPLLDAKDINIDITLEDFYKFSNIEIHKFSLEINEYKVHDISYLTHPKLSLISAIQMTCAIPILITPVCIKESCFVDGGFLCNYPVNYCIESGKNPDEILGFKNKYSDNKTIINNDSTLLDYIVNFLFKAILSVENNYIQPNIKNQIIFDTNYVTFDTLRNAISSSEVRKSLFEKGKQTAIDFLDLKNGV